MAYDTRSLISVNEFKAYLGVSGTSDDTVIGQILGMSIGIIETYYDRRFLGTTTEYNEWHEAYTGRTISLRNWPVVRALALGIGAREAFSIRLDAELSPYTAGSYSVAETRSVLERVQEGSASISTQEFSAYKMVSELATLLDGIDGVTTALIHDVETTMLIPTAPRGIFGRDVSVMAAEPTTLEYGLDWPRGVLTLTDTGWDSVPDGRVVIRYTAGHTSEDDSTRLAASMVQQQIASYLYRSRRRDSGIIVTAPELQQNDTYIQQILEAHSSLKEVR